jgi:hypothetical protein
MKKVYVKPRIANVENHTCPFCRRLILLNSAERRTYHEAPACEQWLDYCANSGGRWEGEVTIIGEFSKRKPS